MKKITLFILIIMIVVSLVSCNISQQVEVEEAETEEIKAEKDEIYVGMTRTELIKYLDSKSIEYFEYSSLLFFEEEVKNTVVRTTSVYASDFKVLEFGKYDKVDADKSKFEKIENGMSMFEIVELVGLPIDSTTFGMSSLDFLCSDGTRYRVYLNDIINTVSSVMILDENK